MTPTIYHEFDHAMRVADGVALQMRCRVAVEPRANMESGWGVAAVQVQCPTTGDWRTARDQAWSDIFARAVGDQAERINVQFANLSTTG